MYNIPLRNEGVVYAIMNNIDIIVIIIVVIGRVTKDIRVAPAICKRVSQKRDGPSGIWKTITCFHYRGDIGPFF